MAKKINGGTFLTVTATKKIGERKVILPQRHEVIVDRFSDKGTFTAMSVTPEPIRTETHDITHNVVREFTPIDAVNPKNGVGLLWTTVLALYDAGYEVKVIDFANNVTVKDTATMRKSDITALRKRLPQTAKPVIRRAA